MKTAFERALEEPLLGEPPFEDVPFEELLFEDVPLEEVPFVPEEDLEEPDLAEAPDLDEEPALDDEPALADPAFEDVLFTEDADLSFAIWCFLLYFLMPDISESPVLSPVRSRSSSYFGETILSSFPLNHGNTARIRSEYHGNTLLISRESAANNVKSAVTISFCGCQPLPAARYRGSFCEDVYSWA